MTIDLAARPSPDLRQHDALPPFPAAGPPRRPGSRGSMASSAERFVGAVVGNGVVEWIGGRTLGADVAASAVGAAGDTLSGDWADIVARPHRPGCSITIGDAMGSGAAAAPSGHLLRLSARAFAACAQHASATITALDGLVSRWDGTIATCLTVDIGTAGHVTAVSAGHPPPLVIDPLGGARFLRVPTAGPLGVGATCAPAARAHFAPGTTIVLYTDGLVARRRLPVGDGLGWLLAVSSQMHGLPVEVVAHRLVQQSIALSPLEDDTTVVAVRLR
jgi:hypothetical protein